MRFIFIGERIMRAYRSCNMLAAVQHCLRHAILMQCALARSLLRRQIQSDSCSRLIDLAGRVLKMQLRGLRGNRVAPLFV